MASRVWFRLVTMLALFAMVVQGTPVLAAWSFDFSVASGGWDYYYYNQLGRNGFFGTQDVDNSSTGGTFAPLNGWVGNQGQDVGVITAGTNTANSDVNLQVDPFLGNEWLQLKGRYTITAYSTAATQGAYVAMSPAQLTTWSIKANTPIITVGYGKQVFTQALGLQFARGRTKEYLTFERGFTVPDMLGCLVSWGTLPPGVLSYFNPLGWGRYNTPEPDDPSQKDPYEMYGSYGGAYFGPAQLRIGFGVYPWERISITPVSWNVNDINAALNRNLLVYCMYDSTDFCLGVGTLYRTLHQGPELQRTVALRQNTPTTETYLYEGWAFCKYNNGRFFLSTELDWYNRTTRFQRSETGNVQLVSGGPIFPEFLTDGSGRSQFAPQYIQSWRYMAEAGMLAGPWMLQLFYAFMPGPDRRHGIPIDRQWVIQDAEQAALGIFDPYSVLLSYLYGSGVNAPAHLSDASIYAARLHYALASNLILQFSYLRATRTSHGYGWGFVRPNAAVGQFGQVEYNDHGAFTSSPPAIPDNDLGWEVSAGAAWKLIEGWAVDIRVNYWKPGKWFNYACIDRSVPNWDVPGPGNNWGVNPGRDIDPVLGLEIRVGASY